ncbi:MAG: dihydrolipoyl dehydrogenase [Muribaculaceae bacterium]|jgi:dihydrolipoamide dehydrogenase|nr:dihydrolipoyl dehydrogenase [Muribaculaceae bacterium]
MKSVDLIIIGAGPGGYDTAVAAAKAGLTVAIIEERKVGGTCLNEGCIPTKCLCHNADIINSLGEDNGLSGISYSIDMPAIIERKNKVVTALNAGVETLLKHPGITLVHGRASLAGAMTVHVEGDDDFTAKHIIIATGSVTKFLPIDGAHLPGVLTSTELLDIDHIPAHLCVIGGGVIGLEFASIFRSFGSEVTVVEFCKEVLPNFDSDLAKRIRIALKGRGIAFSTNSAVTAIRKTDTFEVDYSLKGETKTVTADSVLMAVGRGANLGSLNLADWGIASDRRGVIVDENFRTNVDNVYAIGDINGLCQLAHAATAQGRRALNHILGISDNLRFDIIPAAVFTSPEAAMVGVTEDQCKAQGIEFSVHKSFFRANGKALSMNAIEGILKILTDTSGKIIGCHILGAHASDIIAEVAALMNQNATLADLRDIIHAHPTLAEVIAAAAE